MDSFKDQTARLRKTFRYPADEENESNGSEPDAIDEEGELATTDIPPPPLYRLGQDC